MRPFIVASAWIAVTAHAAHAGARKVKAELLCGTFVDGQVKEALTGGKRPRLSDPVACALHLSVENDDTFMGNIHTVRYAVDPASGKRTKITTSGQTTDIENNPGLKKDVEIVMTPGVADENGEIDFQPCEDFDVVASVSDDRGVYFTKTIHVAQSCPKPKPMKVTAICFGTKDGDRLDLPDKARRSLEGYAVSCYAESSDPRFSGTTVKFWGQTSYDVPTMDDSTDHRRTGEVRTGTYEEGEDESGFSFQLDADDIPVCLGSFDIKLYVDDLAGAHLFTRTVTVKQVCD